MFHGLAECVRPDASICFLALLLHRVMWMRLRKANEAFSPTTSLGFLSRIHHCRISLNGTRAMRGRSKINDIQARVLRSLRAVTPDIKSIDRQLELSLESCKSGLFSSQPRTCRI